MHVPGAVAVCKQKTTVIKEREVRWHKSITAPAFHAYFVLVLAVYTAVHRRVLFPNRLAFESKLGKRLHLLIGADVKKLLTSLCSHLNAMATPLKLRPKGTDELTLPVENKNGRMILLVLASLMDDIEQTLGIDRHIVGCLPSVIVRQPRPAMLYLVTMITLAYDDLLGILIGQQKLRRRHSGNSGSGKETAAGEFGFHG